MVRRAKSLLLRAGQSPMSERSFSKASFVRSFSAKVRRFL